MTNAFDLIVEALREQGLNSDEILEKLSQLFNGAENFQKQVNVEESIEAKIKRMLNRICMPVSVKGYEYWIVAIQLYKNGGEEKSMTRYIYPRVAEICGTTPSNAERAMRFAVERALNRCSRDIIDAVFDNNFDFYRCKLTNTEFLIALAELI